MYYKITRASAELLGEFTYNGINFSPFTREQKDGCYLVAEDIYNALRDSDQFKRVNWNELSTIDVFDDKIPGNAEMSF